MQDKKWVINAVLILVAVLFVFSVGYSFAKIPISLSDSSALEQEGVTGNAIFKMGCSPI